MKKHTFTLRLGPEFKRSKEVQGKIIPALQKAAAKVVKELHNEHFNPKKKMGWDVLYSVYVNDVFCEAFGHNLENYLLIELAKKDCYDLKTSEKHDGIVISKRAKTKRKTK